MKRKICLLIIAFVLINYSCVQYIAIPKTHKNSKQHNLERFARYRTLGWNIHVPSALFGVKATAIGGNIVADSVQKKANLFTVGGNIKVNSISGKIKAGSLGGKVEVQVSDSLTGEISAIGNDLILTIPKDIPINIYLEIASSNSGNETSPKLNTNLKFIDLPDKKIVHNSYGFYKRVKRKKYQVSDSDETLHLFIFEGEVIVNAL